MEEKYLVGDCSTMYDFYGILLMIFGERITTYIENKYMFAWWTHYNEKCFSKSKKKC